MLPAALLLRTTAQSPRGIAGVVLKRTEGQDVGMQAWGWVLEMYAFTISCHIEGVPPAALHIKMMGQPPWDAKLSDGFFLLHYTYGMDYDKICPCLI